MTVPAVRDDDMRLVALWLHGRSPKTIAVYRLGYLQFRQTCDTPLAQLTLDELQAWADHLEEHGLAPATRALRLGALCSLLAFGHRLGLLPVNVGAAMRLPKRPSTLAARILDEEAVLRMLALETDPRNHALLRLLYAAGLRVSELCQLCWDDILPRDEGAQLRIVGKGQKERQVLISAATWQEVRGLADGSDPAQPVFLSAQGGKLDRTQVFRIVAAAAKRAHIAAPVSPHWLRHAHASHALDRGCPTHILQASLGHSSLATTSRYVHVRPGDSSGRYLAV